MSEASPILASRANVEITRKEIDTLFFRTYCCVTALSKSARKPGQAIKLFHESRMKLENELSEDYKGKNLDNNELDEIAVRHSLLALIHWLYPNYIGYNRLANAKLMYQHATAAASTSRSRMSLPYVIGLMVQLRITPFLVKSRNSTPGQLSRVRETALRFLTRNGENAELDGPLGIINDGIGFSYFLLERDTNAALDYLAKATEYLVRQEKSVLNEISHKIPS